MSDTESGDEFDDFMLGSIGSPSPVVGSHGGTAAPSSVEAATGSATKTAERARLLEMGVDTEVTPVVDEMKVMLDLAISVSAKKILNDSLLEFICCLATCDMSPETVDTTNLWE